MSFFKKYSSRLGFQLKSRILFFLDNCNISGIRYLGERCDPWGRILWLIAIIISFSGMIVIFILTYQRFFTDIVTIGIDTAYLNWNSTFPAISICLIKGHKLKIIKEAFPNFQATYLRSLYAILFMTPSQNELSFRECEGYNSTCGIDYNIFSDTLLPRNCNVFLTGVEFSGKTYENCEEIFKLHITPMGYCFIANSIMDYNMDVKLLPLQFNRESKDRTLKFFYKEGLLYNYMMYYHSPEDIPYFNGKSFKLPRDSSHYSFNIEEMENEEDVKLETYDQRGCRFPDENMPFTNNHYSFSTCMSDLQIKLELEYCNCTLFRSPEKYKSRYCTVEGLTCLTTANLINKTKALQSSENVCLPSCNEERINFVGENSAAEMEGISKYVMAIVDVINVPSVRYKREVSRTSLDLVVAIGGVAGLFFGASIINIVEIFYICFVRKF